MRVARRGVIPFVVAVTLLVAAVGPAVASGDQTSRHAPAQPAQLAFGAEERSHINVTQTFSLTPSTPGEVTVERRFSVPDRVVSLRTGLPDDATVTDTTGFDPGDGGQYHWDESTDEPAITYRLPVNETLNDTSPEGAAGEMTAVDAGEWALFRRPATPTYWNYTGSRVGFDRRTEPTPTGAAGEWLVFLGEHESYERTAHDQRFRLVVPGNANMTDRPWDVLDSLADAAGTLRVGDRDGEVFVVAAPTGEVAWGVRGLQTGDADLWVRDVESVDSPDNPWVHEYVHSRQQFSLSSEMRWFREASAGYYATLLTFEQGRIGYEAFEAQVGTGSQPSYADAVLTNQSSWDGYPHYEKGALVAGHLDRRIRDGGDENRTLQAVFEAMNDRSSRTSLSDFQGYLAEHGGESAVEASGRYAETSGNVSTWNRTAHVSTFGSLPARVGFRLPADGDDATYRVHGSYRNATLDGADDELVVVPDETLAVDAIVDNAGETHGNYTARLTVNGSVVDRANGTVAANETETATLSHAFESTGTYELGLGEENVTVQVRQPAEARVGEATVTPGAVRQGESVRANALVENSADVPGEATVVFRLNDGVYESRQVTLGPNATRWANVTVPMSIPGQSTVGVDGATSTTVSVRGPPVGDLRTDGRPTATPDRTTERAATDRTTAPPTTEQRRDRGIGVGARGFGGLTVGVGVLLVVVFVHRRVP